MFVRGFHSRSNCFAGEHSFCTKAGVQRSGALVRRALKVSGKPSCSRFEANPQLQLSPAPEMTSVHPMTPWHSSTFRATNPDQLPASSSAFESLLYAPSGSASFLATLRLYALVVYRAVKSCQTVKIDRHNDLGPASHSHGRTQFNLHNLEVHTKCLRTHHCLLETVQDSLHGRLRSATESLVALMSTPALETLELWICFKP